MPPESVTAFDPVDLALLSSRYTAIVRSMSNTLIRTGRSVNLNQRRDFSCCVVTADDPDYDAVRRVSLSAAAVPASARAIWTDDGTPTT